ncbi:HTH-type transcriptional activator TipA [Oxobacter pfennigii]|uniref:HTH-type transcriptional activator TipA n=1 Tax=Oxobacter pfennigii TaxID=36849 RepID=A0A0P8WB18_9CLOT|nr:HTH-type transcriptional activator TipA [Oxobacter pfennigii]
MGNDEAMFTVGEFAAKAGVTHRTLRYYDSIGLLQPSAHNKSGHRLYSLEDFARLQKIMTLKFIGLPLDDIGNIIKYDIDGKGFKNPLELQKQVMTQKIRHMQEVSAAIDEALLMLNKGEKLNWDKFINIITAINADINWPAQYQNASNLKTRIKVHEDYSTNNQGWMEWFFKQLNLPDNANILELGCGDASLWVKNFAFIPDGWSIMLTDFSPGMLKDAKSNLKNKNNRFKFKMADAQMIPFEDETFDAVIANHMLYHVPDIEKSLSEVHRVLKPKGIFYASTVGKKHMSELRDIIQKFDCRLITIKSWEHTEKFHLENGMDKVSKLFKNVKLKRYEDNLIVTEAKPLMDYIFSMPGNARQGFSEEKLMEFKIFLDNEISVSNGIFISKDTGFFYGTK